MIVRGDFDSLSAKYCHQSTDESTAKTFMHPTYAISMSSPWDLRGQRRIRIQHGVAAQPSHVQSPGPSSSIRTMALDTECKAHSRGSVYGMGTAEPSPRVRQHPLCTHSSPKSPRTLLALSLSSSPARKHILIAFPFVFVAHGLKSLKARP